MSKTARLQIPIEPGRRERLKHLAKARGLSSVAELTRVALDEYEANHGKPSREDRLRRIREILRNGNAPVSDPETMSRQSAPTAKDLRP